jgi:signal transduction histidine kinase
MLKIGAQSWGFPLLLMALCAALGLLQYRWIDEASRAERDRLRAGLQAALVRLSNAVNAELTGAVAAFLPSGRPPGGPLEPAELENLYRQWRESAQHDRLFSRIGLVRLEGRQLTLWLLDAASGEVRESAWPPEWQALRTRMEARLAALLDPQAAGGRPFPFEPPSPEEALLFEISRNGRGPFDPRGASWLVFELNAGYLRDTMLPEHLQRYLGEAWNDYHVRVSWRGDPSLVFYTNSPAPAGGKPDAEVAVVDLNYDHLFRRMAPPGMRQPPRGRRATAEAGRLWLSLQHRAGSLDAVVARTRLLNLLVTGAILLLMMAALSALILSTRRAQRLAELQMHFVTGVSHELRTPLTVIRTAAYNLRGRLAQNPAAVEKYGVLIQKESERLTRIVEQVLAFARAKSAPQAALEPVPVAGAVREAAASCQALLEESGCRLETQIDESLPPVLAEPQALAQCIQNLISNAIKYGGGRVWVAAAGGAGGVEIRVADDGPGIPPEELPHVFEPFFRGRRAIDGQVHGTGLGLALVKSAVESFGGEVEARSRPGERTEFILRLRAAQPAAEEAQAVSPGGGKG